jgi:hypothetical protein
MKILSIKLFVIFLLACVSVFAQTNDALADQAFDLSRSGKNTEALKICKYILKKTPNHAGANYVCGLASFNQNKYADAEKYAETGSKIVESGGLFGNLQILKAKVYIATNRKVEALAIVDDLILSVKRVYEVHSNALQISMNLRLMLSNENSDPAELLLAKLHLNEVFEIHPEFAKQEPYASFKIKLDDKTKNIPANTKAANERYSPKLQSLLAEIKTGLDEVSAAVKAFNANPTEESLQLISTKKWKVLEIADKTDEYRILEDNRVKRVGYTLQDAKQMQQQFGNDLADQKVIKAEADLYDAEDIYLTYEKCEKCDKATKLKILGASKTAFNTTNASFADATKTIDKYNAFPQRLAVQKSTDVIKKAIAKIDEELRKLNESK